MSAKQSRPPCATNKVRADANRFPAMGRNCNGFIGELPGFNAILVITDRFTKIQRYIPARTTWTATDVANAYICHIWKHYGLPKHVTSDRGTQFASAFWYEINLKLDIKLRLSTAYHPQTDRLSKRAVQTLKQYLRIFCHDRQNRWVAWLALAEFAYNSTPMSIHAYSPFHVLYGFQPRTIHLSEEEVDITAPAAEEWLDSMTTVHSQIGRHSKKYKRQALQAIVR